MKKFSRVLIVLAAVSAAVPAVFATGNPHCPKCKMELSSKKDKVHDIAVKIKGKTYYCCTACGAHKVAKKASK